jgi:hypothetical protein
VHRRCAIDRARAAAESAVARRRRGRRVEVDALRSGAELAADLPDRTSRRTGRVFRGAGAVVLAHAECGLRRRPGSHCLSRDGPRSAAASGTFRRADSRCAHEWQGYIPFDELPNAFDPPSGFLATANSRVTNGQVALPADAGVARSLPRRAHLQITAGRDGLDAERHAGAQTDIYSEVDQELGHRFAYAIDHTAGVDDRLRKAADLMRSWDGRLTPTPPPLRRDPGARSAVAADPGTEAGQTWPVEYRWSESDFAEEEIVMHANRGLASAGLQELGCAADRSGAPRHGEGKAPADVSRWTMEAGTWWISSIRWPAFCLCQRIAGHRTAAAERRHGDHVKQVGRAFGPSQRFTMDWSNIDGSTENIVLGESGEPATALTSATSGTTTTAERRSRCPSAPPR